MTNKTENQTNTTPAEAGAVELNDAQLENASGGAIYIKFDGIDGEFKSRQVDPALAGDGSVKPAGR